MAVPRQRWRNVANALTGACVATGDAIAAVIRHRAATVAGLNWSEREDLNLRPLVSQAVIDALDLPYELGDEGKCLILLASP